MRGILGAQAEQIRSVTHGLGSVTCELEKVKHRKAVFHENKLKILKALLHDTGISNLAIKLLIRRHINLYKEDIRDN